MDSGRWLLALGVDAANPTGATRLYEGAGMKVAQQYATDHKELRPGWCQATTRARSDGASLKGGTRRRGRHCFGRRNAYLARA